MDGTGPERKTRREAPGVSLPSRGGEGGQWRLLAAGAALALLTGATAAPPRATPSGLPVPRYVSAKFREINARGGPGDDYKLLFVYRARGLPLQVIAETAEWRRVCDPEGSVAWVHRRTVAETRTVMRTSARSLILRAQPSEASAAPAVLAGRSVATLQSCAKGWCRISADKVRGWVRADEVWGTAEGRQCR